MFDWFADARAADQLGGALRFTDAGLVLSVLMLAHFGYTLVTRCWRRHILVDYWHYVVGLGIVLPFFVMYPFSSAAPSVISVGTALDDIRSAYGDAFSLNLLGYASLLAGRWMHQRAVKAGRPDRLYAWFARRTTHVVQHSAISVRLLELSCAMGVLVLVFAQFEFGAVFGIRDRLFQDPTTRVIFNAWYSVYVVSFALGCLRLAHKRSAYVASLLVLAFACSAVTGSRSMTILTAADVLIAFFAAYKGRISWRAVAGAIAVLGVVIGITTTLRNAEQQELADSVDTGLPFVTLLYGNTLSDLRDFAWVLNAWSTKGELLLGRSYLSAGISFIPRSLSEFRETYSIGTYTNELIGIDSTIHPGVRGGKFLEPYLNFGMLGVMLLGYGAGNLLSRTSHFMALQRPDATGLIRAYGAVIPYFVFSQLLISSGFWVVYVFLFVFLLGGAPGRRRVPQPDHAAA